MRRSSRSTDFLLNGGLRTLLENDGAPPRAWIQILLLRRSFQLWRYATFRCCRNVRATRLVARDPSPENRRGRIRGFCGNADQRCTYLRSAVLGLSFVATS